MATTERSATALVYTNSSVFSNWISELRSTIVSGGIPTSGDHNRLIIMINNMLGHYHTYEDYYSVSTYGNTGSTSAPENKTTDRGTGFPSDIGYIDSSVTITAAKHNEMASACRTMRQHLHNINDRTS